MNWKVRQTIELLITSQQGQMFEQGGFARSSAAHHHTAFGCTQRLFRSQCASYTLFQLLPAPFQKHIGIGMVICFKGLGIDVKRGSGFLVNAQTHIDRRHIQRLGHGGASELASIVPSV